MAKVPPPLVTESGSDGLYPKEPTYRDSGMQGMGSEKLQPLIKVNGLRSPPIWRD